MSGGGWRLRVQFSGAPRPPESEGIHKNKQIPLRSIRKVSADQRVGEFLLFFGIRTVSLRIKVVEIRSRDSRGDPKLKVARVPPGSRRGTAKVALRS